jgi:hypothetical protein
VASLSGHAAVIGILLGSGADPTIKTKNGELPSEMALGIEAQGVWKAYNRGRLDGAGTGNSTISTVTSTSSSITKSGSGSNIKTRNSGKKKNAKKISNNSTNYSSDSTESETSDEEELEETKAASTSNGANEVVPLKSTKTGWVTSM